MTKTRVLCSVTPTRSAKVHAQIARHLITDDPNETARNLGTFSLLSRFGYDVVKDGAVGRFYDGLNEAGSIAAALHDFSRAGEHAIAARPPVLGDAIAAHGPILGYLSPMRRTALVKQALALPDPLAKAWAIDGLGAGLEHLEQDERTALVNDARALTDPFAKARAMGGLWAGLGHLQQDERTALVNDARTLTDPFAKARAMDGLGAGLGHLQEQNRTALVNDAHAMTNPAVKAYAIARMGAGLEHLPAHERTDLVNDAPALTDPFAKAWAIAGVGAGLEHLEQDERTDLVNEARTIPAKPRAAVGIGLAARGGGQSCRERNDTLAGNFESVAKIVPQHHTVLGAHLGQSEEGIAAIAPSVAAGYRLYRCRACGEQFNERGAGALNRIQYPSDTGESGEDFTEL